MEEILPDGDFCCVRQENWILLGNLLQYDEVAYTILLMDYCPKDWG
jgi:hypothetical protein